MEFEYQDLRQKIKEKCKEERIFADRLGISRTSLSLRLHNQLQFTQKDIALALSILDIPPEEIAHYFLRPKKTLWSEYF